MRRTLSGGVVAAAAAPLARGGSTRVTPVRAGGAVAAGAATVVVGGHDAPAVVRWDSTGTRAGAVAGAVASRAPRMVALCGRVPLARLAAAELGATPW